MGWALYAVVAAIIFAAGAASGIKWHAGQDAIAENARKVNERATERLRRQNSETAAVGYEKAKVVIREKYVPITETVERVVNKIEYRDRICLDDDGVHAANRALTGSTNDSSSFGATLPKTAASK